MTSPYIFPPADQTSGNAVFAPAPLIGTPNNPQPDLTPQATGMAQIPSATAQIPSALAGAANAITSYRNSALQHLQRIKGLVDAGIVPQDIFQSPHVQDLMGEAHISDAMAQGIMPNIKNIETRQAAKVLESDANANPTGNQVRANVGLPSTVAGTKANVETQGLGGTPPGGAAGEPLNPAQQRAVAGVPGAAAATNTEGAQAANAEWLKQQAQNTTAHLSDPNFAELSAQAHSGVLPYTIEELRGRLALIGQQRQLDQDQMQLLAGIPQRAMERAMAYIGQRAAAQQQAITQGTFGIPPGSDEYIKRVAAIKAQMPLPDLDATVKQFVEAESQNMSGMTGAEVQRAVRSVTHLNSITDAIGAPPDSQQIPGTIVTEIANVMARDGKWMGRTMADIASDPSLSPEQKDWIQKAVPLYKPQYDEIRKNLKMSPPGSAANRSNRTVFQAPNQTGIQPFPMFPTGNQSPQMIPGTNIPLKTTP